VSYIDVAIPGIIGLVLLLSPQFFLTNRINPDLKKIRLFRNGGTVLLIVAALYLVIKIFNK
jgi:hypothetical protein